MIKPRLLPKARRKVAPKKVTLATRKTCYEGHKMIPDNVFVYMGGTWCRRCRAQSRLRSRQRRAAEFKAKQVAERKATKAALDSTFTKPTRKVAVKAKTARKPKLTGQARIDAELKAFTAKKAAA